MNNSFEKLWLHQDIIKGVYLYGYKIPSEIQVKGITTIGTGKACIIQSQSGTGKTAIYLLGVFNKVVYNKLFQGLIILPTRELAIQVCNVANNLFKTTNYKISNSIGWIDIKQNIENIKNTNVTIGTLGRIYHLIEYNKLNINNSKFIVLDEIDDLLNNGISNELIYIMEKLNKCQKILFSATLKPVVFKFSEKYLTNPNNILFQDNEVSVDLISQFYIKVLNNDKHMKH